jgi:hypothetical protein
MRNLRHLGIMALAAGLLTTSACSGNDRARTLPGVFRPSVGERDSRDRDGDGNRDAKPNKDKGRRDETRCNAGRGNGNGNGRCRNGNNGNGRNP